VLATFLSLFVGWPRGASARRAVFIALVVFNVLLALFSFGAVRSTTGTASRLAHHVPALGALGVAALIMLAAATWLAWRYPQWAVVLVIVIAPLRVPLPFGTQTSNLLVPLYFLLLAIAVAEFIVRDRLTLPADWRLDPVRIALAVMIAVVGVSALWVGQRYALHPKAFANALIKLYAFFLPFAVLYIVFYRYAADRRRLLRLLVVFVAWGAVMATIGIVQYPFKHAIVNASGIAHSQEFQHTFRSNALFWDPNMYGRFLSLVMLVGFVLLLAARVRRGRPQPARGQVDGAAGEARAAGAQAPTTSATAEPTPTDAVAGAAKPCGHPAIAIHVAESRVSGRTPAELDDQSHDRCGDGPAVVADAADTVDDGAPDDVAGDGGDGWLSRPARWASAHAVWLAGAAVALAAVAFVFTFSRSSVAALLIGAMVVELAWLGRRKGLILVGLTVLVLVAGIVGITDIRHGNNLSQRLSTAYGINKITGGRYFLIKAGRRMFERYPVEGVGLGGFPLAFPTFRPSHGAKLDLRDSHTTPVTIAAEQGLIGLAAFVGLLVTFFATTLRKRRFGADRRLYLWQAGLVAGVLTILVHSLSYNAFFEDPYLWGFMALASAVVTRLLVKPPDH